MLNSNYPVDGWCGAKDDMPIGQHRLCASRDRQSKQLEVSWQTDGKIPGVRQTVMN